MYKLGWYFGLFIVFIDRIDPSDSAQVLNPCSYKAVHILLDIHEALLVKIELDSAIDSEPFGQMQSANKLQL